MNGGAFGSEMRKYGCYAKRRLRVSEGGLLEPGQMTFDVSMKGLGY